MSKQTTSRNALLAMIRNGQPMTLGNQLRLTVLLSLPAIAAQISTIVMEYIDAAMVGSLGAEASASIGLMATTTWLFWGLCSSVATGLSVQVANRIGAKDYTGAQTILKQSFLPALSFSILLSAVGLAIGGNLPRWLGAEAEIAGPASNYFCIFISALPFVQINFLASAMLRCSGNTLFPGIINVVMCVLDVVFNFFLIFPAHEFSLFGQPLILPGAGMGVKGAALGTALAELVAGLILVVYLWQRNSNLNLKGCTAGFLTSLRMLKRTVAISTPIGCERMLMCGAQILITAIVAPLGTVAIAANAFAVTAESLCYMPGYGIGEAATVLVGQSLGAARQKLARSFARITVVSGILVMALMGVVMYVAAPLMMGIITPIDDIRELGIEVLRIEAYAEPMFAASIVSYGIFIGAGDTLIPSCMNFGSIWIVRLTLAAILAPIMGLKGVWVAMAAELCFRGLIFLWRLRSDRWMHVNKEVFSF